jgi:spermidine/putrescine-binding protein
MKKIIIISSLVAGLATAGLVAAPSFAHAQSTNNTGNGNGYGYQQTLTSKAQTLGMTEAELRTQLETQTMLQVAESKGLSQEQWNVVAQQAAVERWQERGLTQTEIDSRLQDLKDRQVNCDGDGTGNGGGMGSGGGMHQNRNND